MATLEKAAKTLPGRYYTDPQLFAEEFERFYFRDWICVGRADHIPNTGDYFLRELAGESIIVTRDQSGAVFLEQGHHCSGGGTAETGLI